MNTIKSTLAAVALVAAACQLCHAAYPTLAWTAETSTSLPKEWPLRSGATTRLEARLTSMGRPLELPEGTPCTLYWNTNGMAATDWWPVEGSVSTNGVATATFTAAVPAGVKVFFFFRVGTFSSLVYDALGTLKILPSPGPDPLEIELPPPGKRLDLGRVEVLNAPWLALRGGVMEGPLTLSLSGGITWQCVGAATNYSLLVEHDGTNALFNVYASPRGARAEPLVLQEAGGLTWQAAGAATNYTLIVEAKDGAVNFTIYEEGRKTNAEY